MADQRPNADTFLDRLLSFASPRSAEAEVLPMDAQSREYAQNIQTRNAPDLDQFRKLLYSTIYQKAQAEPQNVTVQMGGISNPEHRGEFHRDDEAVYLNADLPQLQARQGYDPKTTLIHELLHFLAQQYGYSPDTERQHELIDYLLGQSYFVEQPQGGRKSGIDPPMAQMPAILQNPETYAFLQRLFAGTPIEAILPRQR